MDGASIRKERISFDNWGYGRLCGPDGALKQVTYFDNLIVNGGLSAILSFFGQAGGISGFPFIGQGEDSGPIASADTAISTEVGSRIQACYAMVNPRFTWSVVFGSGVPAGGGSIRQIGALISATGGILGAKASLSTSVLKGSGDTATYVWIVSINQ